MDMHYLKFAAGAFPNFRDGIDTIMYCAEMLEQQDADDSVLANRQHLQCAAGTTAVVYNLSTPNLSFQARVGGVTNVLQKLQMDRTRSNCMDNRTFWREFSPSMDAVMWKQGSTVHQVVSHFVKFWGCSYCICKSLLERYAAKIINHFGVPTDPSVDTETASTSEEIVETENAELGIVPESPMEDDSPPEPLHVIPVTPSVIDVPDTDKMFSQYREILRKRNIELNAVSFRQADPTRGDFWNVHAVKMYPIGGNIGDNFYTLRLGTRMIPSTHGGIQTAVGLAKSDGFRESRDLLLANFKADLAHLSPDDTSYKLNLTLTDVHPVRNAHMRLIIAWHPVNAHTRTSLRSVLVTVVKMIYPYNG